MKSITGFTIIVGEFLYQHIFVKNEITSFFKFFLFLSVAPKIYLNGMCWEGQQKKINMWK